MSDAASRPELRQEVETLVHFSPWRDEVPDVPESPVSEWGTLAWARLALALLADNERLQAKLAEYDKYVGEFTRHA